MNVWMYCICITHLFWFCMKIFVWIRMKKHRIYVCIYGWKKIVWKQETQISIERVHLCFYVVFFLCAVRRQTDRLQSLFLFCFLKTNSACVCKHIYIVRSFAFRLCVFFPCFCYSFKWNWSRVVLLLASSPNLFRICGFIGIENKIRS